MKNKLSNQYKSTHCKVNNKAVTSSLWWTFCFLLIFIFNGLMLLAGLDYISVFYPIAESFKTGWAIALLISGIFMMLSIGIMSENIKEQHFALRANEEYSIHAPKHVMQNGLMAVDEFDYITGRKKRFTDRLIGEFCILYGEQYGYIWYDDMTEGFTLGINYNGVFYFSDKVKYKDFKQTGLKLLEEVGDLYSSKLTRDNFIMLVNKRCRDAEYGRI